MIVAVPGATPNTAPSVLTVAIVVALLLHMPPMGVLPRLVVEPWHTMNVPVIFAGAAVTVTTVVL